jgi:hypothetical protein
MFAETLCRCPGCGAEQWFSTIALEHGSGPLCTCGMGMDATGSEQYDDEFAQSRNDRESSHRGEYW